MTGNSPNLDLVNINAQTKFGKILSICSKDFEQKQNSGQNSRANLDLVNINAYTKFGKILSICSQDIEGS